MDILLTSVICCFAWLGLYKGEKKARKNPMSGSANGDLKQAETGVLSGLDYPLLNGGFGTLPALLTGNSRLKAEPVTKTDEAELAS